MFQEYSACKFYFTTADDGILEKGQKPIGLKDRYRELKRKFEVLYSEISANNWILSTN